MMTAVLRGINHVLMNGWCPHILTISAIIIYRSVGIASDYMSVTNPHAPGNRSPARMQECAMSPNVSRTASPTASPVVAPPVMAYRLVSSRLLALAFAIGAATPEAAPADPLK